MADTALPVTVTDDASHQLALREIERLWGLPRGTPDGDRLDALMTAVDAYERARWPGDEAGG
jgi:antitoxin component HigA of HigAB toxin-antitoxin module